MALSELTPMDYRVRIIAQECPVTGNSWDVLKDFYVLPSNFNGLRVLDICAGESDLTASLIAKGADAIAVDYSYKNPDFLHRRRIQTYIKNLEREGITDDVLLRVAQLDAKVSTQRFKQSLAENSERYIQGSALDLPFADNSFDEVFSFWGIVGVFEDHMFSFRRAVNEAIRVTKPGGRIQIGPAAEKSQTYQGRINTSRVTTELMTRTDEVRVSTDFFDFRGDSVQRVTITKK